MTIKAVSREINFGIILLAAGSSKRMGTQNKLLIPVSGFNEPILVCSSKEALDATRENGSPEQLVVVLGFEHQQLVPLLDKYLPHIVFNSDFDSGMSGSIRLGLSYVKRSFSDTDNPIDFIIVALADMPHVRTSTYSQLIQAYKDSSDNGFIIPCYKNQRGNPVLISRDWFDAIDLLEGDLGARQLIANNPRAVLEVPVEDPGILRDYDYPSDFMKR